MVDLVDVFVDQAVVEQAVAVVEPDVVAEHAHQDVEEAGGQVGERPQVSPGRGARGPEAVARKSTRYSEDNLMVILEIFI